MRNPGDLLETCVGRGEVDMVGRNIMYFGNKPAAAAYLESIRWRLNQILELYIVKSLRK